MKGTSRVLTVDSMMRMLANVTNPRKAMALRDVLTIGPMYRAGTFGCQSRTGRPGHGCAHDRRVAKKARGVAKHRQRMGGRS